MTFLSKKKMPTGHDFTVPYLPYNQRGRNKSRFYPSSDQIKSYFPELYLLNFVKKFPQTKSIEME